MAPLRLALPGAAGRMGRLLLGEILDNPNYVLCGAGEGSGHPDLGRDAGALIGRGQSGVLVSEDPGIVVGDADAVIDFTAPCGAAAYVPQAVACKAAYIIGATALDSDVEAAIDNAARHIAVVRASNMSLGINLLTALVEQCAARLDSAFDIEITELHHAHKADAPSGTALSLGDAAARGRGIEPERARIATRLGRTGERPSGGIGFSVARGGDVVGDHSVLFCGPGERLELTHRAGDRRIYALGALKAAQWAAHQPPGTYSMRDVLGL